MGIRVMRLVTTLTQMIAIDTETGEIRTMESSSVINTKELGTTEAGSLFTLSIKMTKSYWITSSLSIPYRYMVRFIGHGDELKVIHGDKTYDGMVHKTGYRIDRLTKLFKEANIEIGDTLEISINVLSKSIEILKVNKHIQQEAPL